MAAIPFWKADGMRNFPSGTNCQTTRGWKSPHSTILCSIKLFSGRVRPRPLILSRIRFLLALLYDGGSTNSWGTRVAYRQKLSDHLEIAALYDWAGALTPSGELDPTSADFRNNIATRNHQSVAARVSGKLPRSGHPDLPQATSGSTGATLSRMDAFGEAESQMDPNLHLSIRQPLPGLNGRFGRAGGCQQCLGPGVCVGRRGGFTDRAGAGFPGISGWGKLPVLGFDGLLKTERRLPQMEGWKNCPPSSARWSPYSTVI